MANGESDAGSSGNLGFNFDTNGSPDGRDNGSTVADVFGSVNPASGSLGTDDGDASGDFDPAIHIGRDKRNADGSYRRKRGRRAGSSNAKNPARRAGKASLADVNTVEKALVGIHAIMAGVFSAPEFALEKDESKPLAESVSEVAKHYDIPEVADVTLAWVSLAMVAGPMYMAKYMLVRERIRAERATRINPERGTVVDISARYKGPGEGFAPQPDMNIQPTEMDWTQA